MYHWKDLSVFFILFSNQTHQSHQSHQSHQLHQSLKKGESPTDNFKSRDASASKKVLSWSNLNETERVRGKSGRVWMRAISLPGLLNNLNNLSHSWWPPTTFCVNPKCKDDIFIKLLFLLRKFCSIRQYIFGYFFVFRVSFYISARLSYTKVYHWINALFF